MFLLQSGRTRRMPTIGTGSAFYLSGQFKISYTYLCKIYYDVKETGSD